MGRLAMLCCWTIRREQHAFWFVRFGGTNGATIVATLAAGAVPRSLRLFSQDPGRLLGVALP